VRSYAVMPIDDPSAGVTLRRVGMSDRVAARIRARELDATLADGADPASRVTLALRARRLIAPRARRRLARSLRNAVSAARAPRTRPATIAGYGPHVVAASEELLALAERLERQTAVDARGVALTQLMLTEGGGPLYSDRGAERLIEAARRASSALVPQV
jgi:hypothetical protein